MNYNEIENIVDGKVVGRHECLENYIKTDFQILKIENDLGLNNHKWQFFNFSYATAIDVAEGEAEKMGEVVSCKMLVINYCPFCGLKLSQ